MIFICTIDHVSESALMCRHVTQLFLNIYWLLIRERGDTSGRTCKNKRKFEAANDRTTGP